MEELGCVKEKNRLDDQVKGREEIGETILNIPWLNIQV